MVNYNDVELVKTSIVNASTGKIIRGEFIKDKVTKSSVPLDLNVYYIRQNPNSYTLEKNNVYIDFYGTFITDEYIEFDDPCDQFIVIKGAPRRHPTKYKSGAKK